MSKLPPREAHRRLRPNGRTLATAAVWSAAVVMLVLMAAGTVGF
jgi:hypothetical protein